jgi:hypothetical protein
MAINCDREVRPDSLIPDTEHILPLLYKVLIIKVLDHLIIEPYVVERS